MRKNATKVAAALLSAAMVVTSVSVPGSTSEAAAKVKISSKTAKLYVKGPKEAKKTVKLTVKKGKKNLTKSCKWTSKNKKVATVGAKTGKVTAKKAGKAKIVATYKGKKYTCKVTVAKYKYATGIELSEKSPIELKEGATKKVKVSYTGKPTTKGVTAKSSPSGVVAVKVSGSEVTLTAKKEGKATITVTTKSGVAKKAKTAKLEVTVKAKAAATAEPTTAPTAPAETGAPAQTTAPTAAPSQTTAPTATAPSTAEPTKAPATPDHIQITSKTALTNPNTAQAGQESNAGKFAYVYYRVEDQYGDPINASVDIQWNTVPAGGTVNKTLGRITIPCGDQKFTYGQQVYVTGVIGGKWVGKLEPVHQAVPVGMTQAVDSIKKGSFGFVDKNEPTKLLKELPKNFAKDTYYFVFQTLDQDGNLLDVNEFGGGYYDAAGLTFISEDPTRLSFNDKDHRNFTITDSETKETTDYAGIAVEPEMYASRGGEVNIKAIGKNTGTSTSVIARIGEAAQIKSIDLDLPSGDVADGDKDVEIPFTAKDKDGNTVTSYETMVRTGNGIILTASDGTLTLKEADDGTAKLTWTDNMDNYNPENIKTYENSQVSDNIARPVILMANVLGGENSQVNMSVQDIRIPTEITATGLDKFIANGSSTTADPLSGKKAAFTYKDQYGKEMSDGPTDTDGIVNRVKAFFEYAGDKAFGSSANASYYGVKVIVPAKSKMLTVADSTEKDIILSNRTTYKKTLTLNADDEAVWNANDKKWEPSEETYKFCVATLLTNTSGEKPSLWNNGKTMTEIITAVPMTEVKDLGVTDLKARNEVAVDGPGAMRTTAGPGTKTTESTDHKKADKKVTSVEFVGGNPTFKVTGKYKGNNVTVPAEWVIDGTNSKFEAPTGGGNTLKLGDFKDPADINIKYSDLFDYDSYGNPAKLDVPYELSIAVKNEGSGDTIEEELANAVHEASTADAKDKKDNLDAARKSLAGMVKTLGDFSGLIDDVKVSYQNVVAKYDKALKENSDEYKAIKEKWDAFTTAMRVMKSADDYADVAKYAALTSAMNDIIEKADGIQGDVYTAITGSGLVAETNAVHMDPLVEAVYDVNVSVGKVGSVYEKLNGSEATATDKQKYVDIAPKWKAFKEAMENLSKISDYTDNAKCEAALNAAKELYKASEGTDVARELSGEYLLDDSDPKNIVFGAKIRNVFEARSGYLSCVNALNEAEKAYSKLSENWTEFDEDKKEPKYVAVNAAYNLVASGSALGIGASRGALEPVVRKITTDSDVSGEVDGGLLELYVKAVAENNKVSGLEEKITLVRKNVVVCAAPAYAAKLDFAEKKTVNPTNTEITVISDATVPKAKVLDQYGGTTDDVVVYTVSEYKETAKDNKLFEFTHMTGEIEVLNNGSTNPEIKGAEIGDTFKVTAKVQGKDLVKTCIVTVGADTQAYVNSKLGSKPDEDFRVKKLGYMKR